MCQIMLTICKEASKIHWVRMRYCEPVCNKHPRLQNDWSIIKIRGKFNWSPLEGCQGLTIENPVVVNLCGSGAGWSSDQEMDDAIPSHDSRAEHDEEDADTQTEAFIAFNPISSASLW